MNFWKLVSERLQELDPYFNITVAQPVGNDPELHKMLRDRVREYEKALKRKERGKFIIRMVERMENAGFVSDRVRPCNEVTEHLRQWRK